MLVLTEESKDDSLELLAQELENKGLDIGAGPELCSAELLGAIEPQRRL